ncbi:Kynurenine formamidase [Tulasnella sp. JGI-2019a]|nr:Kynurenine formamidase [Tulasnella sp. JGI-2019a]KAG9010030.1 Kynurenine formamidase [Tulasnella sp. JGI-2019a]KAG9028775.1 Kynurenine formamidase [Tulasnella sp. JGI-2019a]
MDNTLELAYGEHPLQKLDLYWPKDATTEKGVASSTKPPLIVFCHGGAWRSEDKSEYVSFAQDLVGRTRAAVAIVNYRISPRKPEDGPALHHPAHAQDLLDALHRLLEEQSMHFDANRMILVGHSCGAHMTSSIILETTPLLEPSVALLSNVKGIVITAGIYDVDLLYTNPEYRDFIQGAFGDRKSYKDISPAFLEGRKGAEHIQWLIVQSAGDSLIRQEQADAMVEGLKKANLSVDMDNTSVSEEHFELLRTPGFYDLVDKMVIKCTR